MSFLLDKTTKITKYLDIQQYNNNINHNIGIRKIDNTITHVFDSLCVRRKWLI